MNREGERIQIPVAMMEFNVGGNTIWIQSVEGTVLRLQAPHGCKIAIHEECQNLCSHVDLQSAGDIVVCLKEE